MLLILFDVYIATLSVITPAGIVSSGRAAHILIRAVTRSAESHQASDSSEALQFLPLLSSPHLHHTRPCLRLMSDFYFSPFYISLAVVSP